MFRIALIISTLLAFTTAFHQYRKLDCTANEKGTDSATGKIGCHLVLKNEEFESGRNAPDGSGCYTEGSGENAKVSCAIVCPNAHSVFHSKSLSDKNCFKFISYGLVQKDGDWYLWRSGKCLNSAIAFEIGCKFDDPFENQFPDDSVIFKHLAARIRAS
uniref:Secreted protein n=1 Tax=Elaeophora elaphi TaxID=1147741 RepID=A0A0R3RLT4_9BILA